MADEPKNTGLGAGEHGWLRRQRAAESRMVADKTERARVMEIRKRHRERVEAELAAKRARENGEEPPSEEIELEQVDPEGEEETEEEGEQEEESEEETEGEEEEESEEETEGEEEEEEELKAVEEMTRGELFHELKERGYPQARRVGNDDLRDTLQEVRLADDE